MRNRMQTIPDETGRLSVGEKVAYGFGDVACNVVFALTMSLATYFYTNVIGMSAALVGTILLISRIFDGVSDVIMGIIVDKTKSRFGKARPWVLWMTIPYGLSAVLMFMVPANATTMVQAIYVFVTYNFAVTVVYTALNLPYGALAAMMTRNQNERSLLNVFRMSMAPAGNLIVTALTLPFINRMGGDQKAWITVTVIYAVIAMILLLVCFFGCKERVHIAQTAASEKVSTGLSFKSMLINKYWWMVTVLFFAWSLYTTLNGTMLTYYAQYELGNNELMSVITIVEKLPSIIVTIAIAPFIKKFGKRNLSLAGAIVGLIGVGVILIQPRNLTFVLIGAALKGAGIGPIGATVYAMMADAIEYGHWRTGVRAEGLLYSAATVGYKLGGGLMSAVIGFILDGAGFDGTSQVTQSASAHSAISGLYLLLPLVAWGLFAIFLWCYKLDKEYPKVIGELQIGKFSEKATLIPAEPAKSIELPEQPACANPKTNMIVTISREYGSGGHDIGKQLAEELGIPFYDKQIIALATKQSGVDEASFEQLNDELSAYQLSLSILDPSNQNDKLYLIQSQTIRNLAAQGPCVFVGRCADYVLRDMDNVVNVFITSTAVKQSWRDNAAKNREQAEQLKKVTEMDERRSLYYKHYTGREWGKAANYQLCVDSSKLGSNTCKVIRTYLDCCVETGKRVGIR